MSRSSEHDLEVEASNPWRYIPVEVISVVEQEAYDRCNNNSVKACLRDELKRKGVTLIGAFWRLAKSDT